MSIKIDPNLETRLRAGAETKGLTLEAYLEFLLAGEQRTETASVLMKALSLDHGKDVGRRFFSEDDQS